MVRVLEKKLILFILTSLAVLFITGILIYSYNLNLKYLSILLEIDMLRVKLDVLNQIKRENLDAYAAIVHNLNYLEYWEFVKRKRLLNEKYHYIDICNGNKITYDQYVVRWDYLAVEKESYKCFNWLYEKKKFFIYELWNWLKH